MIAPPALPSCRPRRSSGPRSIGSAGPASTALPVMDGGAFAGLLTRRAVAAAIQGRADRAGVSPW